MLSLGLVLPVALSLQLGQTRPDPRLGCPKGAAQVELPARGGMRVLRCVDDSDGSNVGREVWLTSDGRYFQRGHWERNVRHGLWERWYPTGHLLSRIVYDRGQPVATRCLSEEKRKPFECGPAHMPVDWDEQGGNAVAPTKGTPAAAPAAPPPAGRELPPVPGKR
jgi:hypothetical protein